MGDGIMVSLPQMVDLALGTPELGAVNFNVLHALLHVIIQQLNIRDTNVEFRGKDGDRVKTLLQTGIPGPTLLLTEYVIQLGSKTSIQESSSKEQEVSTVEPRKCSKDEPEDPAPGFTPAGKPIEGSSTKPDLPGIGKKKKGSKRKLRKPGDTSLQTVVLVQAAASQENFLNLQQEVKILKEQLQDILNLPNNQIIFDAVRDEDKNTPVCYMWQVLHLSKRVNAIELGIDKLISMIEDLTREMGDITGTPVEQGPITIVEKHTSVSTGGKKSSGSCLSLSSIHGKLSDLEFRVSELEALGGMDPPPSTNDKRMSITLELHTLRDKVDEIVKQIGEADGKGLKKISSHKPEEITIDGASCDVVIDPAVIDTLAEQIDDLNGSFNLQITTITNHIMDLSGQLEQMKELMGGGAEAGRDLSALNTRLSDMQAELDNIRQIVMKFMEDKDINQQLDILTEQIELLKNIKADKEDLEDALADKADQKQVNKKVSHDQFDNVCDDLSRGLEEALGKLTQQESLWQAALDEIQTAIGNKLDKSDIAELQEFVNNKLNSIHMKLRTLTSLRKETEAAGAKCKIIRDINCISCDKDVIMTAKSRIPPLPAPQGLPPSRSIRPYLTYELDAVRKQQKKLSQSRNLNNYETILKEQTKLKDKELTQGHLCNRYCGGSHTVTTAQQRVTRVGHFATQFGPQVIPLTEGVVKGSDGRFYRTAEVPQPSLQSKLKRDTKELLEERLADIKEQPPKEELVEQVEIIVLEEGKGDQPLESKVSHKSGAASTIGSKHEEVTLSVGSKTKTLASKENQEGVSGRVTPSKGSKGSKASISSVPSASRSKKASGEQLATELKSGTSIKSKTTDSKTKAPADAEELKSKHSEKPPTEIPTEEAEATPAPQEDTVEPVSEPPSEVPTEEAPSAPNETSEAVVESAVEEPPTENPTTETPPTENPTTEDPTTDNPTTDNPTTDNPTTEAPTTEEE